MDGKYKLHTAIFSSGERFPVLLYEESFQPVVIATRFIIDERREFKQVGTIVRDVRVLKWFYEWCDQTGLDIEARFRKGALPSKIEIAGFCRYLRARRNDSVIGAIGEQADEQLGILSPQTYNSYIGIIKDFLVWAAYEFLPAANSADEVLETVDSATARINRAFRSNYKGGKTSPPRYGLTHEEVVELRECIKPGTEQNPFKRPLQFRNYLIVELLLVTGIRRGELLKLKLKHLPQGPKKTLTIERSPDDNEDARKREPQVKTLGREIPIPKPLAVDLWKYAQKYRKRGNHTYLFTSNRGGIPLDSAGVNWIFQLLVERCLPHLKGRLSPHILRHTFNDRLTEEAMALGWDEDQRGKTQRYLNGWSEDSKMPDIYTRRIIEAQAMTIAESFQAKLYSD